MRACSCLQACLVPPGTAAAAAAAARKLQTVQLRLLQESIWGQPSPGTTPWCPGWQCSGARACAKWPCACLQGTGAWAGCMAASLHGAWLVQGSSEPSSSAMVAPGKHMWMWSIELLAKACSAGVAE
eukprot:CAMPEP_0202922334 /NCGR_PEP_ID=MMETSP1392-20130828/77867_1 /ASSEMBLY_ACC=CAM_ASM_000868 /TAXON_ID=225041 /ORGANISM="Chlamydomonas chlamydogama, Strain SAG 11-48b" /LENGTH=126 /DNA_ID=CAMNT_0049615955 /DNA_START=1009 /DNA_END=1390 /DNA_ORIENTATION=-